MGSMLKLSWGKPKKNIKTKKASHVNKKIAERPPRGEKGRHKEKNEAKMHMEISSKLAKKKNLFLRGGEPTIFAPHLPTGARLLCPTLSIGSQSHTLVLFCEFFQQ